VDGQLFIKTKKINMRIDSENERGISITFCSTCKTCPSVVLTKEFDTVMLGGTEEGWSEWTKAQFKEMVDTAKEGLYDKYF